MLATSHPKAHSRERKPIGEKSREIRTEMEPEALAPKLARGRAHAWFDREEPQAFRDRARPAQNVILKMKVHRFAASIEAGRVSLVSNISDDGGSQSICVEPRTL